MSVLRMGGGKRLSQAVISGDTVYLVAVAGDPVSSVAAQTNQALKSIDRYLAEAGSDKSKILSVTIWLRDISGFDDMNREWDAWVDAQNLPVRATVEARLADPRCLVEFMVIAKR